MMIAQQSASTLFAAEVFEMALAVTQPASTLQPVWHPHQPSQALTLALDSQSPRAFRRLHRILLAESVQLRNSHRMPCESLLCLTISVRGPRRASCPADRL